jgi:hypothetical protein
VVLTVNVVMVQHHALVAGRLGACSSTEVEVGADSDQVVAQE